MLFRVALVRTDVSEEPGASFIRVTRVGELGTTKAATSNRRTLLRAKLSLQSPPLSNELIRRGVRSLLMKHWTLLHDGFPQEEAMS
jgi:hypothetical protein